MTIESLSRMIKVCTKCDLWLSRENAVPGEGKIDAKIFVIGEAPGAVEDQLGRPFAGSAGHTLDKMLKYSGLSRQNMFITNLVKCHPPKNRIPKLAEIKICTKNYLFNQIRLINPNIVLILGKVALNLFLPEVKSIREAHGEFFYRNNRLFFVSMHPAYIMRFGRKNMDEIFKKFNNITKYKEDTNDY